MGSRHRSAVRASSVHWASSPLLTGARRDLDAIERAAQRLAADTYGHCLRCGEPIFLLAQSGGDADGCGLGDTGVGEQHGLDFLGGDVLASEASAAVSARARRTDRSRLGRRREERMSDVPVSIPSSAHHRAVLRESASSSDLRSALGRGVPVGVRLTKCSISGNRDQGAQPPKVG
jgi:hypothetical protein